jgi:L-aspartate oxidase
MLPRRLTAADPGWSIDTDVVVIGSGIAGLVAALRARTAGRVLLVTKALMDDGSTRWAQGGIAAALHPGDTAEDHLADTLVAGVGICDPEAVRVLVTHGPEAVRGLVALGTEFDRDVEGRIALTREGGHHRRRIAHAGGDATGAEISRALLAATKDAGIEIIENALALDLLLDEGRVAGVTLHVMGEGQGDGVGAVRARAVILATGGLGQVYEATTNPEVSTGDGVALALRAGAVATDLEFVQFHPTVMYLGPDAKGRQPLISEAVRGEGAFLVDGDGVRFMTGRHPLADLAPRDVVAKEITKRMRETGEPCMYLDGRNLGPRIWEHRFPTILAACERHGVDPVNEPIPVVPAAHYASGGIRTDLWGRTSVPGLYACGEVACTGVHGANRLASNSLLEGLVFAERIAQVLPADLDLDAPAASGAAGAPTSLLLDPSVHEEVQRIMTADAGVIRNGPGLSRAAAALASLTSRTSDKPCTEAWQATNLHTVATLIVAAARLREETRGSHWRSDFPYAEDTWQGHLLSTLTGESLTTTFESIGESHATGTGDLAS